MNKNRIELMEELLSYCVNHSGESYDGECYIFYNKPLSRFDFSYIANYVHSPFVFKDRDIAMNIINNFGVDKLKIIYGIDF